jgi:tetrahydromethanopterin S-methyltransferase subunit H
LPSLRIHFSRENQRDWKDVACGKGCGHREAFIKTGVIDTPRLGMTCHVIQELRREFGLSVGSDAHNAIETWRDLEKKMGTQTLWSSMGATCTMAATAGTIFILHDPIESAEQMFRAIEQRSMPDLNHPITRIE